MDTFNEPYFKSDEAARRKIESVRWPNGPVCPHCGELTRRYATKKGRALAVRQAGLSEGLHGHYRDRHGV
jgi:hypothetical protein